ncbi:MAG: hypothetical protein ACR2HO_05480 [Rubrobacteraceae bacterium]
MWTLFQNTRFAPYESVRLWEDGEGLAGFAVLKELDGVVAQVRTALRCVLEEPILRWAAEKLSDPARNPGAEIWTRALDADRRFVSLLGRLGYRRDEDHAIKLRRRLDAPIPEAPLPGGWTVRPVGGEDEWERRVRLHQEVWSPSRVTLAAYRRLRTAPAKTRISTWWRPARMVATARTASDDSTWRAGPACSSPSEPIPSTAGKGLDWR